MPTRASIAAALSTVTGVKGSEFRPSVLGSGNAWPQNPTLVRQGVGVYEKTWQIYVIAPSDERAAAAWIDANMWPLTDALEPEVFVDQIEPVIVSAGADGDLFAVLITARSE